MSSLLRQTSPDITVAWRGYISPVKGCHTTSYLLVLQQQAKEKKKMQSSTLAVLCVMMSLGMALASYGSSYGGSYGGSSYGGGSYGYASYMPAHGASSGGHSQLLMLIGLLFVLMTLFSNNGLFNRNTTASTSGTPVFVIGG